MSEFIDKVKAGYPLLLVKSYEEFRVLGQFIEELSRTKTAPNATTCYKGYSWDLVEGVHECRIENNKFTVIGDKGIPVQGAEGDVASEGNPLAALAFIEKGAEENSVIFLKDFHPFLQPEYENAVALIRKIRDLSDKFRGLQKTIVFISPSFKIPMELEKDVAVVDYQLPDKETLKAILESVAGTKTPKGANLEAVLDAATGMTAIEAENAFSVSLVKAKKIDSNIVRAEKAQVIKKSEVLEIIEATEPIENLGGAERLKTWISRRKNASSEAAKAFGVKPSKGVLLLGVPGCGKSLAALVIASVLQIPLLRLEMGKVYGKYVGESEEKFASVLKILRSVGRSVLWIDEIEKGLSGNKNGQEGHETTRHIFQMLLTFMQENKDVLLFATANSIDSLPPELLRAGRIDATFFVDLPDAVQCEEIIKIQLRKEGRSPDLFNTDMAILTNLCANFTGAEIQKWVEEAVTIAFDEGHSEIQLSDMELAIKEVTPIYKFRKAEIDDLRQKARAREMKWASDVHESATSQTQTVRRINND